MKKSAIICLFMVNTALSMRSFQSYPDNGRPILEDIYATTVSITIAVQDLKIDSSTHLEAQITALINQRWLDPRLGADMETRRKAVAGQIWEPKITNIKGKSNEISEDDNVFWRGFGEEVLFSRKVHVDVSCTEYFNKFPFDKQICEFQFGSYRFTNNEVSLVWGKLGVVLTADADLGGFKLTNVTTFIETDIRETGNFSVAVVQFTINRLSTHYIYCMAIPCFILVCVSYISLWLGIKRIYIRLSVTVMSFVLLLLLYYKSVCLTAPVSYLKGSDIFVIVNLGFVYVSLLETFIVSTTCSTRAKVAMETKDANRDTNPAKNICWVENGFRVIFPAFYICCLLLYYYTYTG